jgi:hypothetical protein
MDTVERKQFDELQSVFELESCPSIPGVPLRLGTVTTFEFEKEERKRKLTGYGWN